MDPNPLKDIGFSFRNSTLLIFANYFRQFIRDFATIATPLYHMVLLKSFAGIWTDLHQACFEAFKLALANAPTLKMPDFQKPFEVIVDASNVAIGAVLVQDGRPVAYESKKLNETQRKWTTTERELWAGVHALQQWRCYLQHPTEKFTLWTDHNPNIFFSTGNSPLSPRQARWQETLAHYNFEWKYKKGKDNIADALTRLPDHFKVFALQRLEFWAIQTRAQEAAAAAAALVQPLQKNCYCPRTYLPWTITVRGRTCHGLVLSADIPATDYYCPRTYLQRTITAMCRRCGGRDVNVS